MLVIGLDIFGGYYYVLLIFTVIFVMFIPTSVKRESFKFKARKWNIN